MCQEEYNLAKALNDDSSYTTRLLELKLEIIDAWPVWCTPSVFKDISNEILTFPNVKQIVSMIEGGCKHF